MSSAFFVDLSGLVVLGLESVGDIGILQSQSKVLVLGLLGGVVRAGPGPGTVRAGVGLQLDQRVDQVVAADLERLLLAQEDADLGGLLVLEEFHISTSPLLPLLSGGVEAVQNSTSRKQKKRKERKK